jgi:hypothetical protein
MLDTFESAPTKTALREGLPWSGSKFTRVYEKLKANSQIEEFVALVATGKSANRPAKYVRRPIGGS